MAYNPFETTQTERESNYILIWIGAACSLFSVANIFLGMSNIFSLAALVGMIGGLINGFWAHRVDDFFRSMIDVGMRWAVVVITLYLASITLIEVYNAGFALGYSIGNPSGETDTTRLNMPIIAARDLAVCSAATFYAGYAFAWFKNRFGAALA